MHFIVGFSFYVVALVCLALGVIWFLTGKARIFYGIMVEGKSARITGVILFLIGVAVLIFAAVILPRLIPADLFEV